MNDPPHHALRRIARQLLVEPGVCPAACIAMAVHEPAPDWIATVSQGTVTPTHHHIVDCCERGRWHLWTGAYGVRSPALQQQVGVHAPFDLASVTKPFVALTAARLEQQRVIDLDRPLRDFIPEVAGSAAGTQPLDRLLAHRAGLVAHLPLYEAAPFDLARALAAAADALRDDIAGSAASAEHPPVYSDLGFILVGEALRRCTGLDLDELVAREVLRPLGLQAGSARQWAAKRDSFQSEVVPTETVPRRGGELVGQVHDDNAWAIAGAGCAGHAGLFATAEAVARFGVAVLAAAAHGRDGWLSAGALHRLLRPRRGGTLRAGFDTKSGSGSSAGSRFSEHSFGHLGYTGTSLWCDPRHGLAVAMLTNRVCPSADNLAIREARPRVHDAIHALAMSLLRRDALQC